MIAPPAYYAHLAASRARFYMEPVKSDSGSTSGVVAGRGGKAAAGGPSTRSPAAVQPLPLLKENLKKVMFYC